jgi:hypothetical protein
VPGAQYPREIANWAWLICGMGAVGSVLAGWRRVLASAPLCTANLRELLDFGSGRWTGPAAVRWVLAEHLTLELDGAFVAVALRREDLA